jgi:CRP-like cAMP-binding protein
MEGLIKGDVVVTTFPFSDFRQLKVLPALVLAISPMISQKLQSAKIHTIE